MLHALHRARFGICADSDIHPASKNDDLVGMPDFVHLPIAKMDAQGHKGPRPNQGNEFVRSVKMPEPSFR